MKDCKEKGQIGNICRGEEGCYLREQIMELYSNRESIQVETVKSCEGCLVLEECLRLRDDLEMARLGF